MPLLLVIAALLALCGALVENFLNLENMLDLFEQISVNAILAFGMALTIIIGGIDLSVGALLALVGTTAVFVLTAGKTAAANPARLILSIASGLAVAAGFGAFHGLLAATTRVPPFIFTLATMLVARGAAYSFNQAKPLPIPPHEEVFLYLGNGRLLGLVPLPVVVMLVVFAAALLLLHRTRFGQHLYAIGGNREAARFAGIQLERTEVLVYLTCALFAGVAGLIHASQLYSAEPEAAKGAELSAIAAAVVGGTSFTGGIGTMYGTLLGAILIGILDKGLNQMGVHFSIQYMVKGFVILAAVAIDMRRR